MEPRDLIERCRVRRGAGDLVRVVIGVDPPAGAERRRRMRAGSSSSGWMPQGHRPCPRRCERPGPRHPKAGRGAVAAAAERDTVLIG